MSDHPLPKPASPTPDATPRTRGRFVKGNPGGPGRPRSVLPGAAHALDQIGAGVAQEVIDVVVEQARAGNLKAAEIILSRVWQPHRGRPLEIDAPQIQGSPDVLAAQAAVCNAVMDGSVSALDGARVASVIEAQRRAIETIDHYQRLLKLEADLDASKPPSNW